MTTRVRMTAAAAIAAMLWSNCFAGPPAERMLADLQNRFPKTEFSSVHETDVPEVFEIWMGENVAYVSAKNPRYFVIGRMFDTQSLKDVTGPKGARAGAEVRSSQSLDVTSLPLSDAIKSVRGNGSRTMYVFSDPACPYCRKLEAEIAKLNDVTVYTFLLPFQGRAAPLAIWCSNNRTDLWARFMQTNDRSLLNADAQCEHPLDRNLALANRMGVAATPAIMFADGFKIDGYVDVSELEEHLMTKTSRVASAASRTKE